MTNWFLFKVQPTSSISQRSGAKNSRMSVLINYISIFLDEISPSWSESSKLKISSNFFLLKFAMILLDLFVALLVWILFAFNLLFSNLALSFFFYFFVFDYWYKCSPIFPYLFLWKRISKIKERIYIFGLSASLGMEKQLASCLVKQRVNLFRFFRLLISFMLILFVDFHSIQKGNILSYNLSWGIADIRLKGTFLVLTRQL